MRGSMAEFPADADGVFEATLNALSTSAENLPCCLSCTVLATSKHVQSNSKKWRKRLLHFLKLPGTFDCLNMLALF